MRIVNVVDSLDRINFGIWNAAIFTASKLKDNHGVDSELWAPQLDDWEPTGCKLSAVRFLRGKSHAHLEEALRESGVDKQNTIFVTHGVWSFCSRWGYWLRNRGYQWMMVPHGMLEPWPLRQKWLKKRIYRTVFEDRFIRSANYIRAVSSPELANLVRMFGKHSARIELIPNGVALPPPPADPEFEFSTEKVILFLGRLHEKKGVAELVSAFCSLPKSIANNFQLLIVGPDHGQQAIIEKMIAESGKKNVEVCGPAFGKEKEQYLKRSHFFALPSHSEGFPTSIIEAMSVGCVPLLSPGCNFPEAIVNGLAIPITPEVDAIRKGLEIACRMTKEQFTAVRQSGYDFIANNYSSDVVAKIQFEAFESMLEQAKQR